MSIVSFYPDLGRVAVTLTVWRRIMSANSDSGTVALLVNMTVQPMSGCPEGVDGGHIELARKVTNSGGGGYVTCHNTGGPVTVSNPA